MFSTITVDGMLINTTLVETFKNKTMEKSKINFETFATNDFGFINPTRKTHKGSTPEETFKNALNSLPKHISKGWESITFDFEGETIEVVKELLIETDWNFDSSVIITQSFQA